MRNLSDRERNLLKSSQYRVHFKVFFENAEGVFIDYTDFEGINWIRSMSISDDIDSSSKTYSFSVKRSVEKRSLVTLMKDSPFNNDEVYNFKPAIQIGRKFKIEIAITATDTEPDSEHWRIYEKGFIDRVNFSSDPISIEGRCISAEVQKEIIREEREYGSEQGEPVEDEIQKILDDNRLSHINLVTPVSPNWNINRYLQSKGPVYEAIRELAHQIGWELKTRYSNETEDMELQFFEPARNPDKSDWTFTAGDYIDVTNLQMDIAEIRNIMQVVYSDIDELDEDGNPGKRVKIEVSDDQSIYDYGERFMEISEAGSSNINTYAEASRMINNALHDLKDPKADQTIETLFFFPVQLYDNYIFEPNGVHYDRQQSFGVVGYRHEINFERGTKRTHISTKGRPNMSETGNPTGLHLAWFKKEARKGVASLNKFFPPGQPLNVNATTAMRGINITYDLNSDKEVAGYNIYCSNEDNFTVNRDRIVATGSSTQFNINRFYDETDGEIKSMVAGTTYYIAVRAYDSNKNLSIPSSIVQATASGVEEQDLSNTIIDINNIAPDSIDDERLQDNAVIRSKINNGAVDKDKTEGYSGTFETTEGLLVTVENGLITQIDTI